MDDYEWNCWYVTELFIFYIPSKNLLFMYTQLYASDVVKKVSLIRIAVVVGLFDSSTFSFQV